MTQNPTSKQSSLGFSVRLRSALPALQWLRSYDQTRLRGDVVAGITLAADLLPAGLPDASLANLHTPCER